MELPSDFKEKVADWANRICEKDFGGNATAMAEQIGWGQSRFSRALNLNTRAIEPYEELATAISEKLGYVQDAWVFAGESKRQKHLRGGAQSEYKAKVDELREIARHIDYQVRDDRGRIRFRVTYLVEAGPTDDVNRSANGA